MSHKSMYRLTSSAEYFSDYRYAVFCDGPFQAAEKINDNTYLVSLHKTKEEIHLPLSSCWIADLEDGCSKWVFLGVVKSELGRNCIHQMELSIR